VDTFGHAFKDGKNIKGNLHDLSDPKALDKDITSQVQFSSDNSIATWNAGESIRIGRYQISFIINGFPVATPIFTV
jgi:hypothetical protein